jgi:hypothetical protein
MTVKHSIICLDTKKSTLSSPLGVFEAFYKELLLEEAKQNFINQIPDADLGGDLVKFGISNALSFVSEDKLEFHLEHTVERFNHDNEFIGHEAVTEILKFSEQLEQYLFNEYVNSINLIKVKVDKNNSHKKNCEFFRIIIQKLLPYYENVKNGQGWSEYRTICRRPIMAFVTHFYKNYPDFLPSQASNNTVTEILGQHDNATDIYQKTTLTDQTVDFILNFQDRKGHNCFTFTDAAAAKIDLTHLIKKDFASFRKPLNIEGKTAKVYYLIGILSKSLGFTRKQADDEKWFKINKGPFLAALCDTEFSRLRKTQLDWVNTFTTAFEHTLE